MEAHDTTLADGIVRGDISRTVGVGRQSGQVHVDLRYGAFRLDGDGELARDAAVAQDRHVMVACLAEDVEHGAADGDGAGIQRGVGEQGAVDGDVAAQFVHDTAPMSAVTTSSTSLTAAVRCWMGTVTSARSLVSGNIGKGSSSWKKETHLPKKSATNCRMR